MQENDQDDAQKVVQIVADFNQDLTKLEHELGAVVAEYRAAVQNVAKIDPK